MFEFQRVKTLGETASDGLLVFEDTSYVAYAQNIVDTAKNPDGSYSAAKIAAALLAVTPSYSMTGGPTYYGRDDVLGLLVSGTYATKIPADVLAAAQVLVAHGASSSTTKPWLVWTGIGLGGVVVGSIVGIFIGRTTKKCRI